MKLNYSLFTTKNYQSQVKLQFKTLFGNYRWIFHVIFLLLINFAYMGKLNYKEYDLVPNVKAIADFLFYRVITRWICVLGLIYGYFFIVIPIAKIFKSTFIFIGLLLLNSAFFMFANHISIIVITNYYPLSKVLSLPHWYNINGTIYQSLLFVQWSFLSLWYFVEMYLHQKKINNYATQLQMQVQAEKTFLQQQINPHFLFNTLNNIYASSMNDKPKAYLLTKGLNELLQYMTNQETKEFVSLADEIKLIENYLFLEKARNNDKNLEVNFVIKGDINHINIAPLLLINFIENTFKHGVKATIYKCTVNISITAIEHKIFFECINNTPDKNYATTTSLEKNNGIGLHNVQKRLQLLYPAKHNLQIIESENNYAVHLTINIDNE